MNTAVKSSWLDLPERSGFPIYNMPLGIGSIGDGKPFMVSRIGNFIIDIPALYKKGLLKGSGLNSKLCKEVNLNALFSLGRKKNAKLRNQLIALFSKEFDQGFHSSIQECLYDLDLVQMHLPVQPGDYTDFYSSKEHATNVGIMFRGVENALMPNWLHMPIGYHGRSSSIVISGTPIKRPSGQIQTKDGNIVYSSSKQLDIECEMAFVIGKGNPLGEPIPIKNAEEHIQGLLLFNDWSARDIQKWEYQPLGPFLGKNFASSISPWVIHPDALAPFKTTPPLQNPLPLPYLRNKNASVYDIQLEIHLITADKTSTCISKTNMKYLYWTMAQQLAHHTVNGCNMRPGDLCASGTISGPQPDSYGSLLELAWKGEKPLTLLNGEHRVFLQDGDEIVIHGYCENNDMYLELGEVRGTILSAN